MLPKLILVALLLAMVGALFSGLFFLINDTSRSKRVMRALALRVGLSVTLIVFLLIAAAMGWIHPHGVSH